MALDGSGLFKTVLVGFGPTFRFFFSRALARFRCCLRVLVSSRLFGLVQDNCGGFWMFVADFIWLLIFLYGVG